MVEEALKITNDITRDITRIYEQLSFSWCTCGSTGSMTINLENFMIHRNYTQWVKLLKFMYDVYAYTELSDLYAWIIFYENILNDITYHPEQKKQQIKKKIEKIKHFMEINLYV